MSWEAWLTLAVVLIAIGLMVRDLVSPALAVMGGTIVLLLSGVLTTAEAFSGFSNPAPLTVAVLYVLAAAASKTGALQPLVGRALDAAGTDRANLVRLLPPVAAASSVLNNTPIVALLVPDVRAWAGRHGRAASRYLMPVSFAAILGGTVTLIGTTTNLVVSGLLENAGFDPLGFFEMTAIGLPIAIVGVAVVVALSPHLLPTRDDTARELTERAREFSMDLTVVPSGPLDGATVEGARLRHLSGVFLAQLERPGELVAPVAPTTRLRGGDRLRFVGRVDDVVDLLGLAGLEADDAEQTGFDPSRMSLFEAVVGASSPLVGRTLKEAGFRSRYQAAVLAIHRAGHRIDAKLGEVAVRVGDTLALVADPGFRERWRDRGDFLLISPLGETPAPTGRHRGTVAVIVAAVVLTAALTPVSILEAALGGALAVLALRILTPAEARNAVDLDVILLIAGGFGLGEAMLGSGLAETIASGLSDVFGGFGPVGALAAVVVLTVVMTESVSNTAAALIVFPIALATAGSLDLDPRGFAIAIALAASASFLTPVGYQTNVMVYGPGGYRYRDYTRLGLPLTVTVVTIILAGVPLIWPL
jgi:di/tricarboxylate transporter